jgi:heme/copper-type cytochrome/quinol oxidase subunit 2
MELTVSLAVALLVIAAVAVVAFYVVWSRRSQPTSTRPETEPPSDRERDAEPLP